MLHKTNAARILDQMKISYELREYPVDEENLSAQHVAEELGISAEKIYKTLVLKGNVTPYLVAVIPGNAQLDMKKIAKASGNKHCEMLPLKDLLSVTGYIRGGCTALGMKKQYPTFLEEMASLEEEIIISAGKRGLQIVIAPQDFLQASEAKLADLIS
ncbi:Cys-tRNA(Pro) deacylase [Elizabethkingia sp. JS20170427COW]|uniref:Cys-tRNA(Pro) deacylase n=1 Tax=Elizabethkingia sp. JS20170427COW TaxID=2583851 RepID=UPI0011109CD4|nr:Cys-tRNA(Pro) deacylase [Elizabethkingia sp. JS20170427COW]QCX53957.1 Cys-tRNA(Pro) deacylase [Elizabethkingia sp. JS20170427COW]